jgi:hypothetical protein
MPTAELALQTRLGQDFRHSRALQCRNRGEKLLGCGKEVAGLHQPRKEEQQGFWRSRRRAVSHTIASHHDLPKTDPDNSSAIANLKTWLLQHSTDATTEDFLDQKATLTKV